MLELTLCSKHQFDEAYNVCVYGFSFGHLDALAQCGQQIPDFNNR